MLMHHQTQPGWALILSYFLYPVPLWFVCSESPFVDIWPTICIEFSIQSCRKYQMKAQTHCQREIAVLIFCSLLCSDQIMRIAKQNKPHWYFNDYFPSSVTNAVFNHEQSIRNQFTASPYAVSATRFCFMVLFPCLNFKLKMCFQVRTLHFWFLFNLRTQYCFLVSFPDFTLIKSKLYFSANCSFFQVLFCLFFFLLLKGSFFQVVYIFSCRKQKMSLPLKAQHSQHPKK